MSMEFLMGRTLTNAMVNLGVDSEVEEALYEVQYMYMYVVFLPCCHLCIPVTQKVNLLLVLLL